MCPLLLTSSSVPKYEVCFIYYISANLEKPSKAEEAEVEKVANIPRVTSSPSILSGSQTCGGYTPGHGHSVCAGQERGEDFATDPLQSLPQNQRQAWWDQQYSGAPSAVSGAKWK